MASQVEIPFRSLQFLIVRHETETKPSQIRMYNIAELERRYCSKDITQSEYKYRKIPTYRPWAFSVQSTAN